MTDRFNIGQADICSSSTYRIEKKWGAPIVCNDGVTIANEFDLKDAEENLRRPHAAAGGREIG
jgi:chaperonin GroEL